MFRGYSRFFGAVEEMKKFRLSKCFSCSYDDEKCENKQKLSRKKKKELKKAHMLFNMLSPGSMEVWQGISSCYQVSDYNYFRPFIEKIKYYQKHKKVFLGLKELCYSLGDELEIVRIEDNYVLAFPWEYDNGLYTESGHMPMQFGEDPNDKTWAYDASKEYCEHFGLNILEVKNEKHFLELAGRKLNEY